MSNCRRLNVKKPVKVVSRLRKVRTLQLYSGRLLRKEFGSNLSFEMSTEFSTAKLSGVINSHLIDASHNVVSNCRRLNVQTSIDILSQSRTKRYTSWTKNFDLTQVF